MYKNEDNNNHMRMKRLNLYRHAHAGIPLFKTLFGYQALLIELKSKSHGTTVTLAPRLMRHLIWLYLIPQSTATI